MGPFAVDVKFGFDFGCVWCRVETTALVDRSELIDASIDHEHRADVGGVTFGACVGGYYFTDVLWNAWIEQTRKVRP